MENKLNPIECAKEIRYKLREKYPNHTFEVKTQSKDSGTRITITWEDGILYNELDKFITPYLYKENGDVKDDVKYQCKYITLVRLFSDNILNNLCSFLNNDDFTERENEAKSILFRHEIPHNAIGIKSYDSINSQVIFETDENKKIIEINYELDINDKKDVSVNNKTQYDKTIMLSNDDVTIWDYSEKSFALVGDITKNHKSDLQNMRGSYNPNLNINGERTKGWIFSKKHINSVKTFYNL